MVDTLPPNVTLSGDAVIFMLPGDGYTDPGAVWDDLYDSPNTVNDATTFTDVAPNFLQNPSLLQPGRGYRTGMLELKNAGFKTLGTYTITYAIKDTNTNVGLATRTHPFVCTCS